MNEPFDFNQALQALQFGQDLTDKNTLLTPLMQQFIEAALKAGLSEHLSEKQQPNRKTVTAIKSSNLPLAALN